MTDTAKSDIFLDGSCSFCRWIRAKIEPYDSLGRLSFQDYNEGEISAGVPFSRQDLDEEIHVRASDGKWLRGFQAWVAVLRALPKLAWLGWIASVPPLRWMGLALYRFVVKHRYRLPGAPRRCDGDSCGI